MIVEVVGFFFELAAAHPEGQFATRKFEANVFGLPGLIQRLLQVTDLRRDQKGFPLRFGALLLELLQFRLR